MKIKKMIPAYLLVICSCLGLSHLGSRVVTTMVENAPLEDRTCIVIDAGHGGIDGGATSCTGVLESQINLQIALRLESLVSLLGYDTVMIRSTDTSIHTEGDTIASQKVSDLKNRVKTVNDTERGLLVSIHQNTFSDGRYSGTQVFYGKDDVSKGLAKELQAACIRHIDPSNDRAAKKASGIYLMEHIQRPGVLIECGFLSNPEEDAKLNDPSYQKQLVTVIAGTVATHLNEVPLRA